MSLAHFMDEKQFQEYIQNLIFPSGDGISFSTWVHAGLDGFLLVNIIVISGISLQKWVLSCMYSFAMSEAAQWGGPQGKELKPPTNTHVSEFERIYSKYSEGATL